VDPESSKLTSEAKAYRAVLLAAKDGLDWATDPLVVMCAAESLRAIRSDHPILPLLEAKYARLVLSGRPPAPTRASGLPAPTLPEPAEG
jgi:hypothetical protein